ncbi:unnamed protein product [Closterium sp. NIES-53]
MITFVHNPTATKPTAVSCSPTRPLQHYDLLPSPPPTPTPPSTHTPRHTTAIHTLLPGSTCRITIRHSPELHNLIRNPASLVIHSPGELRRDDPWWVWGEFRFEPCPGEPFHEPTGEARRDPGMEAGEVRRELGRELRLRMAGRMGASDSSTAAAGSVTLVPPASSPPTPPPPSPPALPDPTRGTDTAFTATPATPAAATTAAAVPACTAAAAGSEGVELY